MVHDVHLDKHKGEPISHFKRRVIATFERIIHQSEENNSESILIFSHGGVMRVVLNNYLGLYDGPVQNTELISIHKINGLWNLIHK